MGQEIHFEVFKRVGARGGWSLHEAASSRERALEMAQALMADDKATGVKVVKETYNDETGDYLSLKIFEEGHNQVKVDPKAEDAPHALPCFKPDDLYSYHARSTIARLLSDFLARCCITVTELLHRGEALGYRERIAVDFALLRDLDYYTGFIFEGYVEEIGFSLCGGGRYDSLLPRMGYDVPAVGWTAIAMTVMGLSGIVLWWPRKGRWLAAFLVKRGARGLRLHLDLHHAAGIWGLLIFLVLSVSGIYLAFPQTVSSGMQAAFPDAESAAMPIPPGFPKTWPIGPDEAARIATAAVPNTRAVGVLLPRSPDAALMVQLETQGFAPSIPPITVAFDPRNAGTVHIDDPRNYPLPDRILNLLYALHFSVGVGGVWTFLVFVTGLLPLFLAITGLTIWWTKRSRRRSAAASRL